MGVGCSRVQPGAEALRIELGIEVQQPALLTGRVRVRLNRPCSRARSNSRRATSSRTRSPSQRGAVDRIEVEHLDALEHRDQLPLDRPPGLPAAARRPLASADDSRPILAGP
jgi:hypothetical protein